MAVMKLKSFQRQVTNHIVQIEPFNAKISVEKGQKLLTAALEQGVEWPHRCKVGSCGSCKAILLSGEIKALLNFGYVLSQEDLQEGYILACQTTLKSDAYVRIQPRRKSERKRNEDI